MQRGEIWWGEAPDQKGRPYVVLMRDGALPVVERVIVAPITRTIRGIPTEVPLDHSDGVRGECVVTLDNVGTLERAFLLRRLGSLSSARMAEVCGALHIAVDC
jgi:mRNA interferase MazF